MAGSLTQATINTALGAIRKLQHEQQSSASSSSSLLTEAETTALAAVGTWLSSHSSLPGDAFDTAQQHGAEDDETMGLVRAFTSSLRSSTVQREKVLSRLTPKVGRDRTSTTSEPRLSDAGGTSTPQHQHTTTTSDPELQAELAKIAAWDFDVFVVAERSGGYPLEAVAMAAMQRLGLLEELALPADRLRNFLRAVERNYLNNPYHSSTHAADVTQTVVAICVQDELTQVFTSIELLALLLAAVIHDVGHQGVSNDFHIQTGSEWALTYNDTSPNEQTHAATGFRLLAKPHNSFMSELPREQQGFVRGLAIELIMSTDMKHHGDVLNQAKQDVGLFGTNPAEWGAMARAHLMALVLHCADISNCVKPFVAAKRWAAGVCEESWQQGDKERSLGLPLSSLNDRAAANVPRTQKVFLELFGRPSYELLARVAPVTGQLAAQHAAANLAHWEELARQGVTKL